MGELKRVVSISLGTSKRDKTQEVEILGQNFLIERIGTDGDLDKFRAMFRDLDGKVAALGVGGADIYVVVGNKRYAFTQILKVAQSVSQTPVVDGSGLKNTLERETIDSLQRDGVVDFKTARVLMVAAVDRFGMAQAFNELGTHVIYGDLLFGLGVPISLKSYSALNTIGRLILPAITRLPIQWFYPTGDKQEKRTPKYPKVFDAVDVVAGDWHYIHRYAPDKMPGKTILTQTLRIPDIEWLRSTGAKRAITTTPAMGGETFATNVMEGVIVSLLAKSPSDMTEHDYLDTLWKLNWKPNVIELN